MVVMISKYLCRLITHWYTTHTHTHTHTLLICQIEINMQSFVDNRPKQLMLSVCVLKNKGSPLI